MGTTNTYIIWNSKKGEWRKESMTSGGAFQMQMEGYIVRENVSDLSQPTIKEFNQAINKLLENERPKGDY